MPLGSPSISTPNRLDLRAVQTAIGNTRQRIEAIEAQLAQALNIANSVGTISSTVINTLRSQLAALTARVAVLEGYFADLTGTGIAVWTGSSFITRELLGEGGITVINGDGVAGDPAITGSGSDELALDNEGRVGLTTGGEAVFMSAGA